MQLQTGKELISVDGMLVEADALSIAERLAEYDPNIVILCLDPARAESVTEEPFVIAERCRDGVLRPIFKCWELNEMVLTRVQLADGTKFNALDSIEKAEAKFRQENQRRYEERMEESRDIVKHIAGMKSSYSVRDSQTGELITFYDDRPSTRK